MSWLPVYLSFEDPMVYRKFEQLQNLNIAFNESELQCCLPRLPADDIQHPVGSRVIHSEHHLIIWLGVKRAAMFFLLRNRIR